MMNARVPFLTAVEEGESMRIRGEIVSIDQYEVVAHRILEESEQVGESANAGRSESVVNVLIKDGWSHDERSYTRNHNIERV